MSSSSGSFIAVVDDVVDDVIVDVDVDDVDAAAAAALAKLPVLEPEITPPAAANC